MLNEISKANIFEDISDRLADYLKVKDALLENDYFEVLGDSVNIVKFLKSANSLIARKRFDNFLKGFKGLDKPSDFQLSKLRDYIDNETKAEFIADIFSKVFLSNSKLACVIMGSIAHNLIENNKEISHADLICSEALTKFFDYDIYNFRRICEYADFYSATRIVSKRKRFKIDNRLSDFCIEKGADDSGSVTLTLEKVIANQLLIKENEVEIDVDEDDVGSASVDTTEFCLITKPGEQLYRYIQNIDFL